MEPSVQEVLDLGIACGRMLSPDTRARHIAREFVEIQAKSQAVFACHPTVLFHLASQRRLRLHGSTLPNGPAISKGCPMSPPPNRPSGAGPKGIVPTQPSAYSGTA